MVAYTYRMPAGIPGDINRAQVATVEPNIITPAGNTGAPTQYGVPIVIDAASGQVRTVVAADTTVYGLLARPFPTQGTTINDPLGGLAVPPAQGQCDVLKRGYMTVLLSGVAAAIKGAPVNVWTAAPSGTHITGGFEAAVTGGSTIAVPNSYFMGAADASGNIEIAYNL